MSTSRLSHIVLTPATYSHEVKWNAKGFQKRLIELYALRESEEIPQLKDALVARLAEHCVEFRVELSEVLHTDVCTEPGSNLRRWVVAEWWRNWRAYRLKDEQAMASVKESMQYSHEFWFDLFKLLGESDVPDPRWNIRHYHEA